MAMTRTTIIPIVGWTWSAVLAGVFTSLVVQILLVMLGFGVGLLTVDIPAAGAAPAAVGHMAFVWWAVSGVVSAFAGGAVAAAMSPDSTPGGRVGHALASWAVATVIVVGASALTAGSAASVASNLVGPAYSASARFDYFTGRQAPPTTTGQTRPAPTQAQIDEARRHFAYVMLASFVALLLGAGAAYGGAISVGPDTARKLGNAVT